MNCPRCRCKNMVQYAQAYECPICGYYFTNRAPMESKGRWGMRHVTTDTIRELRVFPTVDELLSGARQVAQELRREPGQPRFFLAIFAGDDGYRGVFFTEDHYHREIVGEVAADAELSVAKQIAERELIG